MVYYIPSKPRRDRMALYSLGTQGREVYLVDSDDDDGCYYYDSELDSDSDLSVIHDICTKKGTVTTWEAGTWRRYGDGEDCRGCKAWEAKRGPSALSRFMGFGGKKKRGCWCEREKRCKARDCRCGERERESGRCWKGILKKTGGCGCDCCGGHGKHRCGEHHGVYYKERHDSARCSGHHDHHQHHHHHGCGCTERRDCSGRTRPRVRFADEEDRSDNDEREKMFYWERNKNRGCRNNVFDRGHGIRVFPMGDDALPMELPMASGAMGGWMDDGPFGDGMVGQGQDIQLGV